MAAAKNPSRGEAHYNNKLTDDDCRLILALVEERRELARKAALLTNDKIAEKFEIHPSYVHIIASRMARVDALMRPKQLKLTLKDRK